MDAKKKLSRRQFANYMQDAVLRWFLRHEKNNTPDQTFTVWWRSLHHMIRTEHPKTIEIEFPISQATSDVEDFKANLPTRPKMRKS